MEQLLAGMTLRELLELNFQTNWLIIKHLWWLYIVIISSPALGLLGYSIVLKRRRMRRNQKRVQH